MSCILSLTLYSIYYVACSWLLASNLLGTVLALQISASRWQLRTEVVLALVRTGQRHLEHNMKNELKLICGRIILSACLLSLGSSSAMHCSTLHMYQSLHVHLYRTYSIL